MPYSALRDGVPARGSRDLLQLLANPTNRSLLSVLALEPQYPRRLAELVGLTEHEASRRLRTFERLGLARGEWSHVGKTVRLYRLSTTKFEVTVGQQGLEVTGLTSKAPRVATGPLAELPPAIAGFVGRRQELEELRRLLDERRAVVIQGIGGAGKTALASAFAGGWRRPVLWHTVSPGESGPVLLARLAANARAVETPEQAQRLTMFNAAEDAALLVAALAETAERLGALVVLDRFEHADGTACEAAADLAARLSVGRMLVTTRSWPRDLPRDRVGTFALGGLSAQDSAELLQGLGVTGPRADALHRRTRGHPLALRMLGASPSGGEAGAAFEESALREYLLNEVLPQLAESERDVLLALSLLRTPFLGEEAEGIAENKGTLVALAKLEARGLVLRSGDTYAVHDLVRGFAAGAVPNRKVVHARIAKVLLATGEAAKATEALHQMLEAGQVDKALDLVREEAERGTYRFVDIGLAAPYREQVARLLETAKASPERRAPAEIELGLLALIVGEFAEARRRFDAAADWLPSDGVRAAHALAMGRLLAAEGKPDEAIRALGNAESLAQKAGNDRLLLEALLNGAFVVEAQGRRHAKESYRRAAEAARRSGDVRSMSVAAAGVARMLTLDGNPEAGPMAQEALRLARIAGNLRGEAAAYMTLVNQAQLTGQRTIPEDYAERYLLIAQQLGDPYLKVCALTDTAYFLALNGRSEEAYRRATEGMELARALNSNLFACSGAYSASIALVAMGRAREAIDIIKLYVEPLHPEIAKWPAVAAIALEVLAAVRRALGDEERARAAEAEAKRYRTKAPPGAPQLPPEALAPPGSNGGRPRKAKREARAAPRASKPRARARAARRGGRR